MIHCPDTHLLANIYLAAVYIFASQRSRIDEELHRPHAAGAARDDGLVPSPFRRSARNQLRRQVREGDRSFQAFPHPFRPGRDCAWTGHACIYSHVIS